MIWLQGNEAVQQLSENVLLYDLTQMRGNSALVSRIPENVGGVYAWYRRFELKPSAINDPEDFTTSILDELSKDHCAPREARLPPSHRIRLQPEISFTKEGVLRECAADPSFRQLLFMLLDNSLIFQQPLYIGKASNLHSRICSHLREESILRERLKAAGHNINRCRLLLIHTSFSTQNFALHGADEADEFENQVSEDCELSELASERLVEDILSRLFLPSFTLRYG
ncbi:MAG: hypothetical protein KME08_04115 [Aphanothece sp. CMT-3BRIN-NPC111]|nr:hypothetical protein [Aphanothece sp. CMT-3BRIN-NPC111]